MSTTYIQLTAKYRPQTFAQVVGQEDIRTVLSRAAVQDRIAAAYLFSGTRGVGKTTLARIFAKAINCQTAPTAEPCNQCRHCRQITSGSALDVAEIDGASNRGIEQARRLKEDVGYAPLEGRYKIIIIDEAHMLTKDAFNALLKTLEEPPPGVTFILATTEPQKFPATIISRCQHYVFKRLTQAQLDAHLCRVLELEGRSYEPAAAALLARRAAGSVRDGMSLLEQVLTMGDDTLRLEDVRRILGLAGGDLFQDILQAIRAQDCVAINDILGVLLDQGLDLGFFLRELATLWRNLFLLSQAGEKSLPLLELPDEEGRFWLAAAAELSPTYIHAAWQLTLEGQRQVLTSLEPAQSLEMLLLNLAYLPQLLRLEGLPASQNLACVSPPSASPRPVCSRTRPDHRPVIQTKPSELELTQPDNQSGPGDATRQPTPTVAVRQGAEPLESNTTEACPPPASWPEQQSQEPLAALESEPVPGVRTWAGFLEFYDAQCKAQKACLPGLRQVQGQLRDEVLTLSCQTRFQCEGLQAPAKFRVLEQLAWKYFGSNIRLEVQGPADNEKNSQSAGNGEHLNHPLVRQLMDQFQARVISPTPSGR